MVPNFVYIPYATESDCDLLLCSSNHRVLDGFARQYDTEFGSIFLREPQSITKKLPKNNHCTNHSTNIVWDGMAATLHLACPLKGQGAQRLSVLFVTPGSDGHHSPPARLPSVLPIKEHRVLISRPSSGRGLGVTY